MAFTDATNSRVTGHLTDGFDVLSEQQCTHTHSCGGGGGFCTGVTAANDNDIKLFWVTHTFHPGCGGRDSIVIERSFGRRLLADAKF